MTAQIISICKIRLQEKTCQSYDINEILCEVCYELKENSVQQTFSLSRNESILIVRSLKIVNADDTKYDLNNVIYSFLNESVDSFLAFENGNTNKYSYKKFSIFCAKTRPCMHP